VVAAGRDFDPLIGTSLACDAINQAMFAVDPPRPETGEFTFQRFRLAETGKRRAARLVYQAVYAFQHGEIGVHPMAVVSPRLVREMYSHSSEVAAGWTSSCSCVSPASIDRMDSRKCLAFAGLAS